MMEHLSVLSIQTYSGSSRKLLVCQTLSTTGATCVIFGFMAFAMSLVLWCLFRPTNDLVVVIQISSFTGSVLITTGTVLLTLVYIILKLYKLELDVSGVRATNAVSTIFPLSGYDNQSYEHDLPPSYAEAIRQPATPVQLLQPSQLLPQQQQHPRSQQQPQSQSPPPQQLQPQQQQQRRNCNC